MGGSTVPPQHTSPAQAPGSNIPTQPTTPAQAPGPFVSVHPSSCLTGNVLPGHADILLWTFPANFVSQHFEGDLEVMPVPS